MPRDLSMFDDPQPQSKGRDLSMFDEEPVKKKDPPSEKNVDSGNDSATLGQPSEKSGSVDPLGIIKGEYSENISKPSQKKPEQDESIWGGIKEYARTISGSIEKGWKQGEQSAKAAEAWDAKFGLDLAKGLLKDGEKGEYQKIYDQKVSELNKLSEEADRVQESESVKEYDSAKTNSEAWEAFKKNPVDVVTSIVLKSASQLASNTLNAKSGDSAPGMTTLETPAPTIPVLMAEKTYKLGMSSDMLGAIQESGVDIKDPEAVKKAFSDDKKMSEIKEMAQKRNIPIALVDAVTGGIASKVAGKIAKKPLAALAGLGIEAIGGGVGELAGQVNAGQEIDARSIAEEVLGGIGSGAPNVISGSISTDSTQSPAADPSGETGTNTPSSGELSTQADAGQQPTVPVPEQAQPEAADPAGAEQNTDTPQQQEPGDLGAGQQTDQGINENQDLQTGVLNEPTVSDSQAQEGVVQESIENIDTPKNPIDIVDERNVDEIINLSKDPSLLVEERLSPPKEDAPNQTADSNVNPPDSESGVPGPENTADSTGTDITDQKVKTQTGENVVPDEEGVPVGENPTTKPVKKTVVTKRAYEGEFREGVKRELEKIGLNRTIEKQKESKKKATEFIESVGNEVALEAVRNNDVVGAQAAYVWNSLIESVDHELSVTKDPDRIAELEKLEAALVDEFGSKAFIGGEFNSALGDIYKNSDLKYNLQKQISEYKEQNNGEISPDVEERFRKYDEELKDIKKKLAEAEEKSKQSSVQSAIDNIKDSIERQERSKKKDKSLFGKSRISKGFDDLTSALGTKLSVTGNERAKVTEALTDIGIGLIEEGLATIKNVSTKLGQYIKERLGDKIDFQEYKEDVENRIKLFRAQDETTGEIKIPHSVIRDLVKKGVTNIDDLVSEIKKAMSSEYPDLTDREVRDAITGYGKTVNPNKDEIETQIRKLKRAGRIASALEDVRNKKRPLKSGRQRDALDAEERSLLKKLREEMKDLPVDEATQEEQLRTATDAAKKRLINQIEDLTRDIEKGEQVPKNERTVRDDEELVSLREKRDKVKAEHEKMFNDEAFKERKRTELSKLATKRRIAELERKLKEGDFSKKTTKKVLADDELTKLRAEKLAVQEKYDKELYKNQLENRTRAEKIKDAAWEAWGLTRVLSASMDMSFIGVQGLLQTVSHPSNAIEAFKTSLKLMSSEKRAEKWIQEIKSQDWYPIAKASKLALTEVDAKLTAREEAFYSGWTNTVWDALGWPLGKVSEGVHEKWKKANPFKALERASVGYLDTIRVLRFLDGMEILESQGKTIDKDKQDYKDVADAINTFTGRASIGPLEQNSEILSKIFFSPRNWASMIKQATPYAFYHFGKMTPTARKMAISDFSKFLGLTTAMVAMTAAYLNNDDDEETSVEFDPRSSDFGKIKLGQKRVDPWGGRLQMISLTAKIITDSMKNEKGEVIPLGIAHKSPTRGDLLLKMATNKLSPSASLLHGYWTSQQKKDKKTGEYVRTDPYDKPYSFKEEAMEKLYPMYFSTVSDLYKDDPSTLNGLLAFISYFGLNTSVYEKKEDKKKKK